MSKAKKEMSLDEVKKILANTMDFDTAQVETEEVETESLPIIEVEKPKFKSTIDYVGRGFTSLDDARDFVNTKTFQRLGRADQDEYRNWLNK